MEFDAQTAWAQPPSRRLRPRYIFQIVWACSRGGGRTSRGGSTLERSEVRLLEHIHPCFPAMSLGPAPAAVNGLVTEQALRTRSHNELASSRNRCKNWVAT